MGRRSNINGRATVAIIELSDTYPVRRRVITNTMIQSGKTIGNNANNIPANVPIPFPPRKPANIV